MKFTAISAWIAALVVYGAAVLMVVLETHQLVMTAIHPLPRIPVMATVVEVPVPAGVTHYVSLMGIAAQMFVIIVELIVLSMDLLQITLGTAFTTRITSLGVFQMQKVTA
mmetsp:Transcript_13740/g.20231  ORF Transcript_13740/g.20231 Transcript_13740/m.20231 type:complete len:110 (+) Transcript_13740:111-440(+)